MNRRDVIIGISVSLIFSFFFSIAFATSPDGKVLIQIPIDHIQDLPNLENIPMNVNLRMDDYLIATISTDDLSLLKTTEYSYKILDENPWTQSYYLISKLPKRPFDKMPAVGEVVYQREDEAIVKVDEQNLKEFRAAGFHISPLSEQPLPLIVAVKSQLSDLDIEAEQLGDPIIGALVSRVSDAAITAALQRLQDFQTRWSGSDSVYAASQWLYDQFKKFGYEDVIFDTLDHTVEGNLQRNVIVTKPGTKYPDKIVMLGGHYDSIVLDGTNPLVWAPGVDDNATGTVAALEAARILADIDLESTVIFACWAAEEQGLHGSWFWSTRARQKNLDVVLYINFDMIGNVNPNDPLRDVSISVNQASRAYGQLMSEMATLYTSLVPQITSAGGGSDHYPFMQNGFNFVYGAEGDFSPNWHRRTDTIDNVEIFYCNEVIRIGLATLVQVAGPPENIPGSFVTYSSYSFDEDNLGRSQGNSNGYLDPRETVELFINLKNVGDSLATDVTATLQIDDAFVTIIDSTNSYGDIAAGDSVINSESFLFTISPETPNDHNLIFSLKAQDSSGQSWDSYLLLKIMQPNLVYDSYSITEIVGDGDDIPEAGEICNLFINMKNLGLRPAIGISATLTSRDPDIMVANNQSTFSDASIDSTSNNQNDPFIFTISETALNHTIELKVKVSEGQGYYENQFTVSILLGQGPILLVVDDGQADNSLRYASALNQLGVPIEKWNVISQGATPLTELQKYNNVIWFTGAESKETLSEADQTNLQTYLNNGGNLLLSGDFLGFRLSRTAFYSDYLHAKFVSTQTQLHHLKGVAGNEVTDLDTVALIESASNWPTEIDPIAPAFSILKYDRTTHEGPGIIISSGTAALAVENNTYKIVYCSFRIETIVSNTTRSKFLEDVLSWFNGAPLDLRAILSIEEFSTDDDSLGASLGDGDGFINPGEQIELSFKLVNRGALTAPKVKATLQTTNVMITVIDSVAFYGNVPEDSTVTTTDNFVFKVDPLAPHNQLVLFEIEITDSLNNQWLDSVLVTIQHSNTITGIIVDVGTGQGIPSAEVWWNTTSPQTGSAESFGNVLADATGNYQLSLPIDTYFLSATATGYVMSDPISIKLPPDTTLNFALTSPEIAITPDSIIIDLDLGETYQDCLIIKNIRTGNLFYSLLEVESSTTQAIANKISPLTKANFFSTIMTTEKMISQNELATPPDRAKWKLLHHDLEEPAVRLNLKDFYIQNDARSIYFKQTVYQYWNNPDNYLIYVIFIDSDLNSNTGARINNIGADFAIALGNLGDLVLRWIPFQQGFDAIPGDYAPHHIVLPDHADSLEVGIYLTQIGNPKRLNFVTMMMDPSQTIEDVAPDNGIFHIPYSTFDATWLDESIYYGFVEGGTSDTIYLNFNTTGLNNGSYMTHLLIENNQPLGEARIIPIRLNVGMTLVGDDNDQSMPTTYALHQNYPNPFAVDQASESGTTIKYQLPKAEEVTIKIYNILGQEVATLIHENKKSGYHQIYWNGLLDNGKMTAAGIYLYQIKAGEFVQTKKMLIVH